jgi:hypothetical protein
MLDPSILHYNTRKSANACTEVVSTATDIYTRTQFTQNMNNYHYPDFVLQGELIKFRWTPKNEPTTRNQPPCQLSTRTCVYEMHQ